MIRVENVSYKYKGSDNYILNNLNFTVNDGEVVAIVGKNGSGKSTIGRLISGISKLKEGKITIDDIDVSKKENYTSICEKLGIVFQNPENQIIFNSIYEELAFSLKNFDKSEIEKRIDIALDEVGMLELKNNDLYSLSLGQKQRIVIAEVLAKKPKYIIFDEPTTMLDSQAKEKIYEIIKKLKIQGYTIICITNLADEILLADKTIILSDGKIVSEINKNGLISKMDMLEKYGIKEPTILKILHKFKESGILLDLEEYSIDDLVDALKEKILNEKSN